MQKSNLLSALLLGLLTVPYFETAIEPYMCIFEETKWVSCNHCRCLWAWGMWSCTRNVCSPSEVRGKHRECYHGEGKREGCNNCVCQYGKWVCGIQLCNSECMDGNWKKHECNACLCVGGKYRCTEFPCLFYYGFKCQPKSRTTINCNECVCNNTGMGLTCTDMDCQ